MKKISLLFMSVLVLISGIIFSACDNLYKKLQIVSNVEEINLVLDDKSLSYVDDLVFEAKGVKKWGDISIVSEPAGLVDVSYASKSNVCVAKVTALQPSGDGAKLVVTHLGSGKNIKIPLTIGRRLQSMSKKTDMMVVSLPHAGDNGEVVSKEVSLPDRQLLNLEPSNYANQIIWQTKEAGVSIPGVKIKSFNKAGELLDKSFTKDVAATGDELTGVSDAVKTVIEVTSNCANNSAIILNPIAVLDGKAVLYTNIEVIVQFMDILDENVITITSSTHGRNAFMDNGVPVDDNTLKDLVLISNPDPNNPRKISGLSGYDFYSSAILELKALNASNALKPLNEINSYYKDLYDIELSTNIDDLMLEEVVDDDSNFGKIRVIASSSCYGKGEIYVTLKPTNCVGDIKEFTITIPCTIGERPTLFSAHREGVKIDNIETVDTHTFKSSSVPLNDSVSIGQRFNFEVLSTNTLDALKKYVITIDKKLLYINNNYIVNDDGIKTSVFIKKNDGNGYASLNGVLNDDYRCEYQISILKDGKEIVFYDDGADSFVSEPLSSYNSIYMKWVKTTGRVKIGDVTFGIKLSSVYDERYDIKNDEFETGAIKITYEMLFVRQRTVSRVSYTPVKLIAGVMDTVENSRNVVNENGKIQFYFQSDMLNGHRVADKINYYGIKIDSVYDISGAELTNEAELNEIDLKISVEGNLGLLKGSQVASLRDITEAVYESSVIFNYGESLSDYDDIIIIGKREESVVVGEYDITIKQNENELLSRKIKIYNQLVEEDITVSVPSADMSGEKHLAYAKLNNEPTDWTYSYKNYYEFIGGEYVSLSSYDTAPQFNTKSYYQCVIGYVPMAVKPEDWEANFKSYYKSYNGNFVHLTDDDSEFVFNKYFKYDDSIQALCFTNGNLDLKNSYLLRTDKRFEVSTEISNADFANTDVNEVKAEMMGIGDKLAGYTARMTEKQEGKHIIVTHSQGSFNSGTNQRNYVKLTYTFIPDAYDYDIKREGQGVSVDKSIFIYVYQPLEEVYFYTSDPKQVVSSLEKYSFNTINNAELAEEYGQQIFNIFLNDGDEMLNYVDIVWKDTGDGISYFEKISDTQATYKFDCGDKSVSSIIIATISQFGTQIPISCAVMVKNPLLTKRVELDNNIAYFSSGQAYINLKAGDTIQLNARQYSSAEGEDVSMPGFEYIVCSTAGYNVNSVANVKGSTLTATHAGRVKLIIVAKDRLTRDINSVTNFLRYNQYIDIKNCSPYIEIDVLVSDGSEDSPYLIATAQDFVNLASSSEIDTNKMHYALVQNIDLAGQEVNFNNFAGVLYSYQNGETNNRFTISGIMLTATNPTIFNTITRRVDNKTNISNIDFYVDINYTCPSSQTDKTINIGLVGKNEGIIENITVSINGKFDGSGKKNVYRIGGMVAENAGIVNIANSELIGVQGSIVVEGSIFSTIQLGGLIGYNEGVVFGSLTKLATTPSSDVHYDVTYDNQGATTDITLRVYAVENDLAIGSATDSAIGGVIGRNAGSTSKIKLPSHISTDYKVEDSVYKGHIENIYSVGKVECRDDRGALTANNVGGIIGSNNNDNANAIKATPTVTSEGGYEVLSNLAFDDYENDKYKFQIVNVCSVVEVVGKNDVGGIVGYDNGGTYKKAYYEIYTIKQAIIGYDKVGGVIGYANNTTLQYCYANNFAWNYAGRTEKYDITGNNSVGGLIGYAFANRSSLNASGSMNIVSSLASVSLSATSDASGLIGKMKGFGVISTAYYYGVIENYNASTQAIVKVVNASGAQIVNKVYIYTYAIIPNRTADVVEAGKPIVNDSVLNVDGLTLTAEAKDKGFDQGNNINNGAPYIKGEDGKNIVSAIPTKVVINEALFDNYFTFNNAVYQENKFGDYMNDGGSLVSYDGSNCKRYILRAQKIDTTDTTGNDSDYRAKALLLYYYQFSDLTSENAIQHMFELNTFDMHAILDDDGIKVVPDVFKRFNLRSSNSAIATVLEGGKLLLKNEGQVTITLISQLNPSATASFVVFVRAKVLNFGLYSSANIREEFNINGKTLSIEKDSSKIIYADYSSSILYYNNTYQYNAPTNMRIKFTITPDKTLASGKKVSDYISMNGSIIEDETDRLEYWLDNNITITIKEHCDAKFSILAQPYVVADYVNGAYECDIDVAVSSYYKCEFKVETKRGIASINTDQTLIEMMPSDNPVDLGVKISTDIKPEKLEIYAQAIGDYEADVNNEKRNSLSMIDIIYKCDVYRYDIDSTYDVGGYNVFAKNGDNNQSKFVDISGEPWDEGDTLQELSLRIKLNSNAYNVNKSLRIQVKLQVDEVETIFHININPQQIISVIPLNYRMQDNADQKPNIDHAYQTTVIRPGSTNIIVINVNPDIAIYDYAEIQDTSSVDKILFQQVTENLELLENMDSWVDGGIKLKKYNYASSKLYLLARLPEQSTANISHILQIRLYDANGNLLKEPEQLILQAIMYPTIEATYHYPNERTVTLDTRYGNHLHYIENTETIYLATGVEAEMSLVTYNIDEGSLSYKVEIKDGNTVQNNNDYVTLSEESGKYFLRFNADKRMDMLNKTIEVSFMASKQLNGITETCQATFKFTIVSVVVHGVSLTHTTVDNKLYGNWGIEFATEFCFDKKDISYYNDGYWNMVYTLDNISSSTVVAGLQSIRQMLEDLNSNTNVILKLKNDILQFTSGNNYTYNNDKVVIKNVDNKYKIRAERHTDGDDDTFIPEEDEWINNTSLEVDFILKYGGGIYPEMVSEISSEDQYVHINCEFGFTISEKMSIFEYKEITTQAEFEKMIEGDRYILANDIELKNYSPIEATFAELNGAGHTITIKNFNRSQLIQNYTAGDMNIGLFSSLGENSVARNLIVKYDLTEALFNLDSDITTIDQAVNNIYFGGITSKNLGVITNANTLGRFQIKATRIKAEQIIFGGIAGINGSSDTTKVATITNSTSNMQLAGLVLVGGVAEANFGKIANTVFSGKINVSGGTTEYVSSIFTAGFVAENMAQGYISLSYVETGNIKQIYSVGDAAGFVFNNAGEIHNCYINDTDLSSQGYIGGFVYKNPGTITHSYAYATMINSTFYEPFIGDMSSEGTIESCYFISDTTKINYITGLKQILLKEYNRLSVYDDLLIAGATTDAYSGNKYSVWIMRDGPKLQNAGFDLNVCTDEELYIVYDLETFDGYFVMSNDKNLQIYGRKYRIVRDIDFEDVEQNPITYNHKLMSSIEGNDMALSNYRINNTGELDRVGLFGSIVGTMDGVYVRNLILQPAEVKASGSKSVGVLAGEIQDAYIYNITLDNDEILVLGKNAVGGLAGVIKGDFDIMGINSNISAFASYVHNVATQYNLYIGKNVSLDKLITNLSKVSYAGAIAGIVDGYGNSNVAMDNREKVNYKSISKLNISGAVVMVAETVGGAFGLVGETTLVNQITYNLEENARFKGAYVAGGLVGENRGIIDNANIYATQDDGSDTDTTACFDKFARVNGAIIGLNIGGLVCNSISDIQLCTSLNSGTVGGIVGRNVGGSVYGCTVSSELNANYAGGIIGTDYTYTTISAQQSGIGTITASSKSALNPIKAGVKYTDYLTSVSDYAGYNNNTLTAKFIKRFLANQTKYYQINPDYVAEMVAPSPPSIDLPETSKKLVITSSVFGFVIGFTGAKYYVDNSISEPDKQNVYKGLKYVDGNMTVSLTTTLCGGSSYKLKDSLTETEYIVKPMLNIGDATIRFEKDAHAIIYIIACNNMGYESWISSRGYDNDTYITFNGIQYPPAS